MQRGKKVHLGQHILGSDRFHCIYVMSCEQDPERFFFTNIIGGYYDVFLFFRRNVLTKLPKFNCWKTRLEKKNIVYLQKHNETKNYNSIVFGVRSTFFFFFFCNQDLHKGENDTVIL